MIPIFSRVARAAGGPSAAQAKARYQYGLDRLNLDATTFPRRKGATGEVTGEEYPRIIIPCSTTLDFKPTNKGSTERDRARKKKESKKIMDKPAPVPEPTTLRNSPPLLSD